MPQKPQIQRYIKPHQNSTRFNNEARRQALLDDKERLSEAVQAEKRFRTANENADIAKRWLGT